MTVMQSYSLSLTYTSLRMYVSQTAPATVPASSENAPVAKTGDTVTVVIAVRQYTSVAAMAA